MFQFTFCLTLLWLTHSDIHNLKNIEGIVADDLARTETQDRLRQVQCQDTLEKKKFFLEGF